jgi:NADPH-dependent curcumin reductase CurA
MAQIWHLAARPDGNLTTGIFALSAQPDPALDESMVRVENHWLSVDPYMRGMLDENGSYMPALPVGSPVHGGAIGRVVESRAVALPVGTMVLHNQGWRDLSTLAATDCTALPQDGAPIRRHLGHLGMPGKTAYFGLLVAAEAREGDIVFISSAGGAVGTAALQIAKIKNMTVIASCGGAEKCAALKALGADAVIDYKSPGDISGKLRQAAPDGISVYFDNVGGDHFEAAIDSARVGARFALCGMVSGYGERMRLCIDDPMRLVMKRLRLRGFAAPDFNDRHAEFYGDMLRWTLSGELKSPETVHEGLEAVPTAFVSLFSGGNLGKMLVRLAPAGPGDAA